MKELNEIMDEIEARKNLCKERLDGASADETIYNLAAIDMANSIQEAIKIYMKSEDDLSVEPEYGHYFTDSEYRILLAAIDSESKVCRENDEQNKDHRLSRIMTGIRRKIRRVQYENIWVPYQKNDGWFSVELSMPKEYPSVFAKFKGTSRWKKGMFEKVSKEVNVTLENDEGKAVTTHAPEPEDYAIEEAVKALKEIQNYRKLGTLEELARAKKYIDLAKKHGTIGEMIDECAAYEEIGTIEQVRNQKDNLNTAYKIISDYEACGTVEECRKATEKQKPKKCIEDSYPDHTHYKCPSCGKIQKTKYDNSTFGCILNNCSNCGQALEMEVEDD